MSSPSEPPPRDLPGDYAVIRSVGAMLFQWDGPWRWDGHNWQPTSVSTPRGPHTNLAIVDELAEFLRTVMEDDPRDG